MAFLASAALCIFGRSLVGTLGLLERPVERLSDDLAAAAISAAFFGLGTVLVHHGLAIVAVRQGVTGLAKRMLIPAAFLTICSAAVLSLGAYLCRDGFYRDGRPFVPSIQALEVLVRRGLIATTLGFGMLAFARGIVAGVGWSGGRLPTREIPRSRASAVLRWIAYLSVIAFTFLFLSSCQNGRRAAFEAISPKPGAYAETIREIYRNLDILVQKILAGGVCLGLFGLMEIVLFARLPRGRTE
jgi:hypothetical protein